ncbi:MAG: hypothetical protein O7B99_09595, partial [Planctomycetota bacterium]|nr:hypothetical protein [Planctomycetota bacterium]
VPDTPSTQVRVRVRMDNQPGIDYYDVSDGDLTITPAGPTLTGPVPGVTGTVNTITMTGATAGGLIGVGYSLTTGTTPVGGICPAAFVMLANPTVIGLTTADAFGDASFGGFVPPSLSGTTLYLQGVDLAGCAVTNLVTHTFP